METGGVEPSVRLLGLAFMAPVAGYVLITPGRPASSGVSQILRAGITVLVSAAILVVTTGSDWHVSHAVIRTQYSAFSNRKVDGALAIRIGLGSATIQLYGSVPDMPLSSVNYNEKFTWSHEITLMFGAFTRAEDMKRHYKDALLRGLPYPILTAAEYLSLDSDGFRWGRHYRQAGYYAYFCLWSAFALWLLSNILWPIDIMYSALSLATTGLTLLVTIFVYSLNLSKRALAIPYEGQMLEFTYGWCYYLTGTVGLLCIIFGSSIFILRSLRSPVKLQQFAEKIPLSIEEQYNKSWKKEFHKYKKLHNSESKDICWSR